MFATLAAWCLRRCRIGAQFPPRDYEVLKRDRHVVDEPTFSHVLDLERRRSERSGRPLCLVLLDNTATEDVQPRDNAFHGVVDILRGSIRQTDTTGWYRDECIAGVIFSEISSSDRGLVIKLVERVTRALATAVGPQVAAEVQVSFRLYPTTARFSTSGESDMSASDLMEQNDSRSVGSILKRSLDIVVSSAALLVLAPLFIPIALAIRLTSEGSVVFRQIRIGLYGKPFVFLKFRSMYLNNSKNIHQQYVTAFIAGGQLEKESNTVFKLTNDPRITVLGRFLRRTSLDELPQLWNVFCGDMSLVGPRPAVPYEVDCYAAWHWRRVLEVKPGITGLWQITGRSRTDFNDMVRLDLRYIKNWCLWSDIKILLQTPKAVITGGGAY